MDMQCIGSMSIACNRDDLIAYRRISISLLGCPIVFSHHRVHAKSGMRHPRR